MKLHNKFILVDPIHVTNTIGGVFEKITLGDPSNRHVKGRVFDSDESLGIEKGSIIMYDRTNAFDVTVGEKTYSAIKLTNLVYVE